MMDEHRRTFTIMPINAFHTNLCIIASCQFAPIFNFTHSLFFLMDSSIKCNFFPALYSFFSFFFLLFLTLVFILSSINHFNSHEILSLITRIYNFRLVYANHLKPQKYFSQNKMHRKLQGEYAFFAFELN